MSWNNRVVVETYKHIDGTIDHIATIVEVHYGDKVGSTGEITPSGCGSTEEEAISELKRELERMLEAVNFVQSKQTTVYNFDDVVTHDPGARSEVMRQYRVLDRDDDFMDERYGEDDA